MYQMRTGKFPRKGGEGTTLHNRGFPCNCWFPEQKGNIPGKNSLLWFRKWVLTGPTKQQITKVLGC